jgi:hypothetical protein
MNPAGRQKGLPERWESSQTGVMLRVVLGKGGMNQPRYLTGVVWCFLLVAPGLSAQTLQIINEEGHSASISAAQIANAPHVTVEVVDHDVPARFEGVPLSAVLAMAGIQLGDTMRGPRMAEVLLVRRPTDTKSFLPWLSLIRHSLHAKSFSQTSGTGKALMLKKAPSASWRPATRDRRDGSVRSLR